MNKAEEREENESSGFRPLNDQFFSPNEREKKGDKGEPLGEADGDVKRENWLSVPSSTPKPIQHCTLLKVELMGQRRSKGEGDMS